MESVGDIIGTILTNAVFWFNQRGFCCGQNSWPIQEGEIKRPQRRVLTQKDHMVQHSYKWQTSVMYLSIFWDSNKMPYLNILIRKSQIILEIKGSMESLSCALFNNNLQPTAGCYNQDSTSRILHLNNSDSPQNQNAHQETFFQSSNDEYVE